MMLPCPLALIVCIAAWQLPQAHSFAPTQALISSSRASTGNPTIKSTSCTRLFNNYLDSLADIDSGSTLDYPTSSPQSNANTANTNTQSTPFQHIPILSLEQADAIANNVIAICKRNNFNPVTVYVLDAAGSTLVSKRMDGCSSVGIPDFAYAKAYSCVVNRYPSRAFRDRYTTTDEFGKFGQMLGMVAIADGKMAPFPGGIVLKVGENVVGAVGVSGAAGDEDEYCGLRGVVESNIGGGLVTVPEEHSCSTVKDQF